MSFINLLIDQHDEGYLPYNEIVNLQKIKEGWRLPTKDELNYIFIKRAKIGGFAETIIDQDGIIKYPVYWSSTFESNGQCIQSFGKDEHAGFQGQNFSSENSFYVRLVKMKSSIDIIGTPFKIDNLEVAQYDFPQEVNWTDAEAACASLANGWRLPTRFELSILYKYKDQFGDSLNEGSYWSSSTQSDTGAFAMSMRHCEHNHCSRLHTKKVLAVRGDLEPKEAPSIISSPNDIIGTPIKIDNLEVAQYDFPEKMSWQSAESACASLANGWRLPTEDELKNLYLNKDKTCCLGDWNYWSSTEYDKCLSAFNHFKKNPNRTTYYGKRFQKYVRAVKALNNIIGTPFKMDILEVAQYDFPEEMNWDEANKACNALGKGWRLPTKDELNTLYQNKDFIGGFFNTSYWGTSLKTSYMTDDNISDVLEGNREWDDFNVIEPIQFSFNQQDIAPNTIPKCMARAVKDIIVK